MTDSEGIEVDVETLSPIKLKQKRKYRKKTKLSISQRKNYKKHIPPILIPTAEYKSPRDVQLERHQKNKYDVR